MPEKPAPPAECANCGASIPRGARACPECGADERTGWRETSVYDGIDLPEESSELRGNRASRPARHVNGLAWYWWAAGIGILLVFALAALALL